jgi:hypothetical protein
MCQPGAVLAESVPNTRQFFTHVSASEIFSVLRKCSHRSNRSNGQEAKRNGMFHGWHVHGLVSWIAIDLRHTKKDRNTIGNVTVSFDPFRQRRRAPIANVLIAFYTPSHTRRWASAMSVTYISRLALHEHDVRGNRTFAIVDRVGLRHGTARHTLLRLWSSLAIISIAIEKTLLWRSMRWAWREFHHSDLLFDVVSFSDPSRTLCPRWPIRQR